MSESPLLRRPWIVTALAACAAGLVWMAVPAVAFAQLAEEVNRKRLFEREPFDRITCTKAFEGEVIDVKPIPFPNRRLPEKPKPGDKLPVQRLDADEPY